MSEISFFPETIPKGADFPATVVGCYYYGGVRGYHVGQRLRLVREPRNPHDANAIAVYTFSGRQVGHLQKETASWFAIELDRNVQVTTIVTAIDPGTESVSHGRIDHRPPRLYVKIERRPAESEPVRPADVIDREKTEAGTGSKPCFIVTAACGSENDPLVLFYRKWRDDKLCAGNWGLVLVAIYSRWGPYGASILCRVPSLKGPVRLSLKVLSCLLRSLNSQTAADD